MDLICGINPVLEALFARERHFDRLLIAKGLRNRRISEAIARAGRTGIPLRFEPRETLDRLAGGVPHQGVIAVVSEKPTLGLETLLQEARSPALVVVLDGVEDPRNLGAILRSAEAAGADGVLLPERHNAGLSESVARTSAGAIEHVKVARIGNVAQALDTLKQRGLWVVGFDAAGTERWDAVDLKRPVALVLGGEGRGMRRLVRERCDHLVSIPLFGHVASLNVSVVAGIALYEAVRQRGAVPSHVRPIPARPSTTRRVTGPVAGDAEEDPGGQRLPEPAVEEDWTSTDTGEPLVLLGEEEDASWWGPQQTRTVQEHRERSHDVQRPSRGPRDRRRRRRRPEHGAHPRPGAERPPADEQPPAVGGAETPAAAAGPRRGRRRRRGRPRPGAGDPAAPGAAERSWRPQGDDAGPSGGGPDDSGPPGSPEDRHAAGEGGAPGASNDPNGPPGASRRRRRRRRRR